MKAITSALFCLPLLAAAQTTHFVEMGGSTISKTQPYYAPAHITIDVGDHVRWTNVSGSHNVNGRLMMFPNNPEGFYSGIPTNGVWSYQFTFTIPGVYDYHCDSEGHSATQSGSVTVVDASGMAEGRSAEGVRIYPQPVRDVLTVDAGDRIVERLDVIGIDGRMIAQHRISGGPILSLPMADLPAGNYILRIYSESRPISLPFSKF